MKTQIDNNQRKFLVQSRGFTTTDIFCNLADIPTVLQQAFEPNEKYVIYEYWNRKLKKCSKKHINEMFIARSAHSFNIHPKNLPKDTEIKTNGHIYVFPLRNKIIL